MPLQCDPEGHRSLQHLDLHRPGAFTLNVQVEVATVVLFGFVPSIATLADGVDAPDVKRRAIAVVDTYDDIVGASKV